MKKNQPIFTDAQTSCMPKDYFCIKDNFAKVWNDDIIHTCPYFKVKQMTMNVTNDIALGDGFLLQLQETIKDCNIEIIRTAEGLYLKYNWSIHRVYTSYYK